MLWGTFASLLGNLLTGKGAKTRSQGREANMLGRVEQVKANLKLVTIFNFVSSFNKFWNTKVLSKRT